MVQIFYSNQDPEHNQLKNVMLVQEQRVLTFKPSERNMSFMGPINQTKSDDGKNEEIHRVISDKLEKNRNSSKSGGE